MKEISQLVAGFVDHGGLYQPLAQKLSQAYKRIIYHDPCEEAFPTINHAIIGDSYPPDEKILVVDDIWKHKREIDFFILPDSRGEGLQDELLSQGFSVWGSHRSIRLEQDRELFNKTLKRLGFELPKYQTIEGIDGLREYLVDKEDKYIKISKYRGTMETYHWRSWDDDEHWLDWMAVKLGGVKNILPFLVFDAVETDLELGGDTYRIGGKWPSHMLDGYEHKDKGYFGTFKAVDDMPEQTREVMEAFAPVLDKAGHNNFWSMEIRVKDDHFFFLDPTPRGPIPASGSEIEGISNLPEVIAAGAEGEMIDPIPTAEFVAECALVVKTKPPMWASTRIPAELEQWVKLSGCCYVDGRAWFPPIDDEYNIGWLVALGDTPKETINKLLEQAALLPDGVKACTESMVDLLKEIHSAEEQGIEFSDQTIPEPQEAIET